MPALVAGIHALVPKEGVDGRDKPGHDDRRFSTMNLDVLLRLLLRDIPRVAIGLILLLAIAINFANIVGRYLFLAPLAWAEEVLSFLVIWGVAFGASAVTYERRHLAMDLFSETFPPRLRRAVDVLILAAMIALCGFACIQGWTIVAIMAANGQVSITAGVPMTIPYFSFVVGFGLITVAAVVQLLRGVTRGPRGLETGPGTGSGTSA